MKAKDNFNFRLLKCRIHLKYDTMGEFAKACGYSRMLISEKLNNKSRLNADNIMKMCEVLNIPRDEIGMYFFNKDEEK